MRCTKTGRRRDGYLDAKSMAQRRRRSTLPGHGHGASHAPLALFYEWANADEKRSFHFFQHITAPSLSGDFDGVFWRVLVLQICETEPAVKHAVLAVSSLHEGMMTPCADAEERNSFALSQYNKAIACLMDPLRDVDARPLVPLLTCVLFVCIELMQSKDNESLLHLEQGRQILGRLGKKASSQNPEVDIIKQHLVPMYTRLSLTSLMFGCDPVAIPLPLKTLTDIPMTFDTMSEVRYALYDLMDECLRFAKRTKKTRTAKCKDIPADEMRAFEREQDYLLRKLAKFNVAFSLYQSTKSRDAPPGAIALMQIHVHTTHIWVSTALSNEEAAFDSYVSTFSSIIPLASSFLDVLAGPAVRELSAGKMATSTPSAAETRRFSALFTFEIHVIAPLYFVAAKCRHPLIRRAALDLLRRNPTRRENMWRANVMAAIAEQTIKLEEKHLRRKHSHGQSRSTSPCRQPATFSSLQSHSSDLWDSEMRDAPAPGPIPMSMPDYRADPSGQTARSYGYEASAIPAPSDHTVDVSFDALDPALAHLPIDPTLLYDTAEVASSAHTFSAAPSIASSFDDMPAPTIYVGGSGGGIPATSSMAADRNASVADPAWGFLQPHGGTNAPPDISLEPPTPSDMEPWVFDSRRGSGPSEASDDTLDSPALSPRSSDAPFDVPEHFRVHDAIIGPEKEDGSWIMMFRKLHGPDADWDVHSEYVPSS